MIPDLNSVLNKLSNPFRMLLPDEKAVLKEKDNLLKREIKEFSSLAKELFDDQRYKKLKELFKGVEEHTIYLMKNVDIKDKDLYLVTMLKYQIQLKTLEKIFTIPEEYIQKEEALVKKSI